MQKIIAYSTVIFFLFITTYCCTKQQGTGSRLRPLTYGMPADIEKQNAKHVIAEKWGIQFYAVAGCMVSQELVDSVDRHNKIVEDLIAHKYGKSWRDRFYKQVDDESEIEKKVKIVIAESNDFSKRLIATGMGNNNFNYFMTPVPNSTKYNVSVCNWGKWQGKDEWLTYYKLKVDYRSKSITLVSDKIIKE